MFNLEQAIQSWKRSLKKSSIFEEGQIKEMETNLRHEIEGFNEIGFSEEVAFKLAVTKFGGVDGLSDKIYKTKTKKVETLPPWYRVKGRFGVFPNYLKTAFRNFRRHKAFFFINVLGLSIGLACSILILLWVQDELSIDKFHNDVDQVYRVMEHQQYADGEIFTTESSPSPLAPALKEEVPEIAYATTFTWNMFLPFKKENKFFKERGIYARRDLFNILMIDLLLGNKDKVLGGPGSIVISKKLSKKYFGNRNPIGESITIGENKQHLITGVFKNLPENSTIRFDYVLPYQDFLKENNGYVDNWRSNGPRTLIKLREGADKTLVNQKIKNFVKERAEESIVTLFLYPYSDYYLYGRFENGVQVGGNIEYVRLFSIIALFVLIIACINFMNLSTARASKSTKEVGIRKSIGATKSSLVWRYIGESVLVATAALFIAISMIETVIPLFNDLTDKQISMNYFDGEFLAILVGIVLCTGFMAGIYPALYLSSFEAAKVLKGNISTSAGEIFARRGLVVFQFTLSMVLIICTILIYQQVQYVQTQNLGYQKENLISIYLEGSAKDQWKTFSEQLEQQPGVLAITRSNNQFLGHNSNTGNVNWKGKNPDASILFETIGVDYQFSETMGIELVSGRDFSEMFSTGNAKVMINEKAAEAMGMDQPEGKIIKIGQNQNTYEIIGVTKNFHFTSLRQEVSPVIMYLGSQQLWNAFIRVSSDNINTTLSSIRNVYEEFNPEYPFNYEFMDQQYAALYRSEMRIGDLSKYFGIFAILISCLGLLGLSAFTAERRAKEIGIRKVLGASVQNLVLLLNKDFTRLVLIAIVIAVPISWWLMEQWLNDYANRVEISWEVFVLAGALVIFIAWATTAYQSIRASVVNPVKSLRSE